MNNVVGTMFGRSREMAQGWSLSLLLHLGLVFTAVTIMPKMTLVIEPEPFKWDVALVESSPEMLREETPPPVAKIRPSKPTPVPSVPSVEPPHETVMARVAPQQSPQMTHPVVEPPKPQQPIEPVQQIVRTEPKLVEPEPVRKEDVKEPAPVVKAVVQQESVKETVREVVPKDEPVNPTYVYQAPTQVSSRPAVESPPELVAAAPAPVAEPASPAPSAPPAATVASEPVPASSTPSMQDRPPVVASAPAPRAATKANYTWLAESLGRRIAALTRYPSAARMNGWEGRVVLRAVIRADGNLANVTVQKSSGYEALDLAALETVRLACPIPMKHALSGTEVAVNVPIVYSLSN